MLEVYKLRCSEILTRMSFSYFICEIEMEQNHNCVIKFKKKQKRNKINIGNAKGMVLKMHENGLYNKTTL